jgi:hypothetical protein
LAFLSPVNDASLGFAENKATIKTKSLMHEICHPITALLVEGATVFSAMRYEFVR